jgi:hypothetical protein
VTRYTEAELIALFDAAGNSPAPWLEQGEDLLAASAALIALWDAAIEHDPPIPSEAVRYHDVAIMLRAMAFECLLKARAARQRMVIAKDGRYVLRIAGVRDHDLVALAEAVNFKTTTAEQGVLRRLSRWISAGRYPIQRRWHDQVRLRSDGLVELLTVGWEPSLDLTCDELIERLSGTPEVFGVR